MNRYLRKIVIKTKRHCFKTLLSYGHHREVLKCLPPIVSDLIQTAASARGY